MQQTASSPPLKLRRCQKHCWVCGAASLLGRAPAGQLPEPRCWASSPGSSTRASCRAVTEHMVVHPRSSELLWGLHALAPAALASISSLRLRLAASKDASSQLGSALWHTFAAALPQLTVRRVRSSLLLGFAAPLQAVSNTLCITMPSIQGQAHLTICIPMLATGAGRHSLWLHCEVHGHGALVPQAPCAATDQAKTVCTLLLVRGVGGGPVGCWASPCRAVVPQGAAH